MAELLVKAIDAKNSDPLLDAHCYKRGDIVDVRPDGWGWGLSEGPPLFVVVKIPGVSAKAYQHLTDPHYSEILGADATPIMLKRREWKVNLDSVPAKSGISSGRAELSLSAARSVIENKATLEMMR